MSRMWLKKHCISLPPTRGYIESGSKSDYRKIYSPNMPARFWKKIVGLCEDVPFKETLVPKERKSNCLTGIDYSLVVMQIDQMWLSTLKRMRMLNFSYRVKCRCYKLFFFFFWGNTFDKWRDKKLNGMVMPFVEWERKTCNLWTERRFRWLWTAMFLTAKWRWKPHDLNSKCPKMEFSQWLKRS